MAKRKFMDCRELPSESNCTLKISGTEEEVLQVARRHAIEEHGHEDKPELVRDLKSILKDEE